MFAPSKFHAPRVPDTLVSRPRLVATIDDADLLPLTLVVGAPGSGKTSLLAEWYLSADDGSVAWMSADSGDTDPTRFWRGCIRALQQVETGFGTEADDLISLDGGVTADTLESLLDDDHRLRGRIRLVIDDFHLVSIDAAQQLQHLLQRGLQGVRLILGSRTDPAVGLHRLRLDGSVSEIRDAALRFDLGETRALTARLGVDAEALDLTALHRRTEGWAAGVQMAALSLVGADDPAARAAEIAGNTQTIAGYLTGEVLASQTPRVRRFLENTCVADELDAELARALMVDGADDDHEPVTLQEIEGLHLLLSRTDQEGSAFRYHQLFGELLRSLVAARDPERLQRQHELAALHLEQRGRMIDAIRHRWYAGQRALAARLVSDHAVAVYLSTGAPPPIDLQRGVNDDELRASPADGIGYALIYVMNGRPDLARSVLHRVGEPDTIAALSLEERSRFHCVCIGAELQFGDSATAVHHVESMFHLIDDDRAPVDQWVAASLPFWLRACAWEERFDLARRVRALIPDYPDPVLQHVEMPGALALVDFEVGDVARSAATARHARDAAVALGVTGGGADVAARSALGLALLDLGQVAAAAGELSAVAEASTTERLPSLVLGTLGLARSLRCDGQFEQALVAIEAARQRCAQRNEQRAMATRLDLAEIDIRLAAGDIDTARSIADRLEPGWRTDVARSRTALAIGDTDRALALLGRSTPDTGRQAFTVALHTLAIALVDGSPVEHVDTLANALLDVAEPTGILLPIAEAGGDVLQAAKAASRRRERSEFVQRLHALQPLPLPSSLATPRSKADELSSRELVVLRHMATSMSNQEIADELYVSVNTVKTHIKHVLRKLDATSRTQAVQQARIARYL